jgi:hypothetical protein
LERLGAERGLRRRVFSFRLSLNRFISGGPQHLAWVTLANPALSAKKMIRDSAAQKPRLPRSGAIS